MRIIECDLHARQQTLAMLDTTTGEMVEVTVQYEGDNVRGFVPRCQARSEWVSKPREIKKFGLRKTTKETGLDRKTICAVLSGKKVKVSTLAKVGERIAVTIAATNGAPFSG